MTNNNDWLTLSDDTTIAFETQLRIALAQREVPPIGLKIQWSNSAQGLFKALKNDAFELFFSSLQRLDLQDCDLGSSGIETLSKSGLLCGLTKLNLRGNQISDKGAQALANAKNWLRLEELDLSFNGISDAGAEDLASASQFSRLTSLDLGLNRIGNKGAAALANALHLNQITKLHLHGNRIGDEGIGALSRAIHLSRITNLNLNGNQFGKPGVTAFANATHLNQLTELDLSGNHFGKDGAHAFAGAAHLNQLTKLILRDNRIGDLGVEALTKAAHLSRLTSLNLRENRIGDMGARALAAASHLNQLTKLYLHNNQIGDLGLQALSVASHFNQLTELYLNNNQIGDAGVIALSSAKHLNKISRLNLSFNHIQTAGAQALANAKHLDRLSVLELGYNQIENEGVKAIANAAQYKYLNKLDLRGNKIGDEGASALAASRTLLSLTSLFLSSNSISDDAAKQITRPGALRALNEIALSKNLLTSPEHFHDNLKNLREHYSLESLEVKYISPLTRTLLIGPPCAGKTILFEALTNNYQGLKTQARTQGFQRNSTAVVFRKIIREDGDTVDLTLDLWDMGGHSLQHMLHRLFFRTNCLYILVVNEESLEQMEELSHWLTPLANLNASRQLSTVLPVLNPHRGTSLGPQTLELLIKDYRDFINIVPPVAVQYFANSFDINAVWSSLRSLLVTHPIDTYWQVHDEISDVVRLWQDDYLLEQEFERRLQKDETILGIFERFIHRLARQEPPDRDQFFKTTADYLDNAGVITLVHPYVILNPRWVSDGLYVLFPPEPLLRDNSDTEELLAVKQFRERLQSVNNKYRLPGLFSLQEVEEALACKNFISADRKALLSILSHHKLGIMISLESIGHANTYFIPHYLDQFGIEASNPDRESELAKTIIFSCQHAQACQVIDCDYWPEFFLYQFMVAYWPTFNTDKNQPLFRTSQDLKHINRSRIRIESLYDEYSVDLIFFQNRTWCFGYSTQTNASLSLHNLIREVQQRLRDMIAGIRRGQSHLISMQSSFPCPKCMATLIKMAVNVPSQNESELLSKLKPGDGLVLKQILEDQQDAGGVIRCGNHFITRAELLGEQTPDSKQKMPPLLTPEILSKADQLHVNGLIALKRIADWKGYSLSDTQIGLAPATLAKIKKGVGSELAAMKRGTVKTITDVWTVQKGIHIDFPAELIRILKLDYLPNTLPKLNDSLIKYAEALEQEPTGKRKLTN